MTTAQFLLQTLSTGRLLKRARLFSEYLYYHGIQAVSPRFSLERPRFRTEESVTSRATRDRTSSIEFHLISDDDARKEFDQPDGARRAQVTHVQDKFRTNKCFNCDAPLTPIVQVIDAADAEDFIEISWCETCDYLQYSVMPAKAWISSWYASNWDSGGTIADKLEDRRTTYRYFHRLAPYIGSRKLKILDIGAGYGEKTRPFAEAGHEVHCTEATTRRANYLREKVTKNVYFGTLDDPSVREALRQNGPFDLIFTYHVIEPIYGARAELQILHEIASDNALFYLAIPELYKEGILNNIYALEHISSFSRTAAKMLMKQCGFQTIYDRDDIFQYYSNYCQYLIGRKMPKGESISFSANNDPSKMARYLNEALSLKRISAMTASGFSLHYNAHAKLTYAISDESKIKCRNPSDHLPIRIYHHDLPLFWMVS